MKTALIRVLAIATLASSMTAFAATDEPKNNDAATVSASQQQDGCSARTEGRKQKKAKTQRDDQHNTDKNFDRSLLGIYG